MAKLVKKPGKKLSKKVKKIVNSDVFTSIAIVSLLLNVLFLVSLFVLTSTDTFNKDLYSGVKNKYCSNIQGIRERAEELGSEDKAVREWQVDCVSKEFKPYFDEAVKKFNAQLN